MVKGTDGLLRIDFVRGAKSGGREASLEEVPWDRWFELFDEAEDADDGDDVERPAGGDGARDIVVVHKDGDRWLVEIEGDGHRKRYATKADAVHHARELARRHPPSELVIERVDGEEQDRIAYGDPAEHAAPR